MDNKVTGSLKLKRFRFFVLLSILAICVGFLSMFLTIRAGGAVPTVTGYDLDNKVAESKMVFKPVNDSKKTAKFVGLLVGDDGGASYNGQTLSIPATTKINGVNYTVVEIDTSDSTQKITTISVDNTWGYDHDGDMYSIQAYGSNITALIVPDTVEKINDGAFYGMASLIYYKAPFVGTSITDKTYPLHKAFAKGYLGGDIGGTGANVNQVEYYKLNSSYGIAMNQSEIALESKVSYWYQFTENSKIWYEMPKNLAVVEITGGSQKNIEYGNRTFTNIVNLQYVKLPDELITVGEYTFGSCGNLKTVTLSKNMDLSIGIFSDCTSLKQITVPYNITSIPENAFFNCTNLEKVYLPASIMQIGDTAFCQAKKLKIDVYNGSTFDDDGVPLSITNDTYEVNLPRALKEIGVRAFESVESITQLVVPTNVTYIGSNAFRYCKKIKEITLPFVGKQIGSSETTIENNFGWIFGSTVGDPGYYYGAQQNGVIYYIPRSLEKIEITNETRVEAMTMGNLCVYENNAIAAGVKTITVNTAATINTSAFAGSNRINSLTVANIGSSLASLFAQASDNINTTAVSYGVPDALIELSITNQAVIYNGSLHNCINLVTVTIGNATTNFEEGIFYHNDNLTNLVLPFVGESRGYFYRRWWYWRDLESRNQLSWIFSRTASGQGGTTYEDRAIAYYDSYVRRIPNNLKTVTITDETSIDYYSFRYLTSLTSLSIIDTNNKLEYISAGAAWNCYNIIDLHLPWIGYNKNTGSESGSSHRLGYIFGDSEYRDSYLATGYYVPNSLETVTIDYVDKVPDYAFYNAKSINTITFKSKVSDIGNYSFSGCTNLSTIKYTEDTAFTHVGSGGFNNCSKINLIERAIPAYALDNAQIYLDSYALAGTSISAIDFNKIKKAGDYSFSKCLNLISVSVTPNTETFGRGVFSGCSYLTTASISDNQATAYLFSDCINLTGVDLSTGQIKDKTIPEGMFSNCQSLVWEGSNGLYLTNEVEIIGPSAFAYCTSLKDFNIPTNVKTIGSRAFLGVNGLSSIIIPRKVTSIGSSVFTEAIGNGFVIWVYSNEDEWPSGWSTNWNCLNPVLVIPGDTASMYTYIYSADLKGYVITGLDNVTANSIEGLVNLPATFNAVPVVGIIHNVFANQNKVTKVTIPASYKVIGEGVFQSGERVDIYFEAAKDKSPYYIREAGVAAQFREDNDFFTIMRISELSDTIPDSASITDKNNAKIALSTIKSNASGRAVLNRLVAGGYVFYGDVWQYGSGVGGVNTPFVKLSSLKVNLDLSTIPTYNGREWKPAVTSVVFDDNYIIVLENNAKEASRNINNNLSVDLFNYAYSNNIKVGDAKVTYTLNDANYTAYIANARTLVPNSNYDYSIPLTGTGVKTFQIEKYTITIFFDQEKALTDPLNAGRVVDDIQYDNKRWSYSAWNSSDLSLYSDSAFGNRFTFTGTLSTGGKDVGTYMAYGDSGYLAPGALPETVDFYWSSKWRVYLNGTDVTSNFDVAIFLTVEIVPKEVVIDWTGKATYDYKYFLPNSDYTYSAQITYYDIDILDTVDDETEIKENLEDCYVQAGNVFNHATSFDDTIDKYYRFTPTTQVVDKDNYTTFYVREAVLGKYEYTGYEITPTAAAYVKNTLGSYDRISLVGAEVAVAKLDNVVIQYPNSSNVSQVRAYIRNTLTGTGAKNYTIINCSNILSEAEDMPGATNEQRYADSMNDKNRYVDLSYKAVPANVTIHINDLSYVIGYDDLCYSYSNWRNPDYVTVTGLSPLSTLIGEIISVPKTEGGKANERGTYKSSVNTIQWNDGKIKSANGGLLTGDQLLNYGIVAKLEQLGQSFVIAQVNSDGTFKDVNGNYLENTYYNVKLDVTVQINYNDFDVEHYVTKTAADERPLVEANKVEKLELTYSSVEKQLVGDSDKFTLDYSLQGTIEFAFDGQNNRYFKVDVVNENLYESSITKPLIQYVFTDETGIQHADVLMFDASLEYYPELKYEVDVTVTRENFNPLIEHLTIIIKKCKVQYNVESIEKEYDGLPVSLYGYVDGRKYYKLEANTYVQLNITSEAELVAQMETMDVYYSVASNEFKKVEQFITRSGKKSTLSNYTHIATIPDGNITNYPTRELAPEVQTVSLTYYTKNITPEGNEVMVEWDKPYNPTYPGTYYVYIEATNHDFFEPMNKFVEFVISKRKVNVYVTSTDPFKNLDNSTNKIYDEQIYSVVVNSLSAPSLVEVADPTDNAAHLEFRKQLFVGNDNLFGTLNTESAIPGTYTPARFIWSPEWMIIDPITGEDHTEYYEIVVNGTYIIKEKQFQYTLTNYDGVYDGSYHSISVSVQDPDSGYTIKYCNYNPGVEGSGWRGNNYYFVTSYDTSAYVHDVYVLLQAPFYESKILHGTVTIRNAQITYDLPTALKKDEDGKYVITDVDGNIIDVTESKTTSTNERFYTIDFTWESYSVALSNIDPYDASRRYYVYRYENNGFNHYMDTTRLAQEGLYQVTAELDAYNFDQRSITYYINITEANLQEFTSIGYYIYNGSSNVTYDSSAGYTTTYDGKERRPVIQLTNSTESNSSKIYWSLDGERWSLDDVPTFKNAGEYKVYYKVTGNGVYKTVQGEYNITINKAKFKDVAQELNIDLPTFINYAGEYDGESHSVTVNLGGFEHDPYVDEATANPSVIMYTTYINRINDYMDNYWTRTAPTRKNVGTTILFIRITLQNFEYYDFSSSYVEASVHTQGYTYYRYNVSSNTYTDAQVTDADDFALKSNLYLDANHTSLSLSYDSTANYYKYDGTNLGLLTQEQYNYWTKLYTYADNQIPEGSIVITKCYDPKIDYTENKEIQYKKSPVTYSDLGIKTIHDGAPLIYYYVGILQGDNIVKDPDSKKISAPTELGYYYVEITYPDTTNCASKSIGFGFTIIPRRVLISYENPVEYSGHEQPVIATVDSGTSDILYVKTYQEFTDQEIKEIGEYHYRFEFTVPQTNYVIVIPGSDDDHKYFEDKAYTEYYKNNTSTYDDYPFAYHITKIQLKVVIDTTMACDYVNQKYWEMGKDSNGELVESAWIGQPWYSKLFNERVKVEINGVEVEQIVYRHHFKAYMITNSYARGTYFYSSDDPNPTYSNVVNISDVSITDDDGNDVSDYYEVTYDIKVWIKLPDLDVKAPDTVVDYDGLEHTITINVGEGVRGAVFSYLSDKGYKEGDPWSSTPITETEADEYTIWFKVSTPNYEDFIGSVKLIINKINLNIEVAEFEQVYDGASHTVSHSITNIATQIPSTEYIVKYYDASTYTQEELNDFYMAFDEKDAIYKDGLNNMVNAGTYYMVIYYYGNGNWYKQVKITEVTIKQRTLFVKYPNDIYLEYDYNKKKIGVNLGSSLTGAQITTTQTSTSGLLDNLGHVIYRNKNSQVQTISANAGDYYGSTGFEFVPNSIQIIATTGSNMGEDVTQNYKPVFPDNNLHVRIKKIYLTADEFKASNPYKQYDGQPANPIIETPSDGPRYYTYYIANDVGVYNTPIENALYTANVGEYFVLVTLGEGTNYYAWDGNAVSSYVTITKREVDLVWEDLNVDFNGKSQIPTATLVDVSDVEIPMYVSAQYDGALNPGATNAGLYEVFATSINGTTSLNDSEGFNIEKNYVFNNFSELYTINKVTYTFVVNVTTDVEETEWSKTFTNANVGAEVDEDNNIFIIGTKFNNLTITNKAGTSSARISSQKGQDGLPASGTFYQIGQFDIDIKIVNDAEVDVTKSIDFDFNGVVTIVSRQIRAVVYNDDIEFDDTPHKLKDNIIVMTSPVNKNATWRFKINDGEWTNDPDTSITDVGTYSIKYEISVTGYESLKPQTPFEITIKPKQSFINFSDTLDQPYDGIAVDAGKAKDVILNAEYNGYTDGYGNLNVTFYPLGSNQPLEYNPVDSGTYRVVYTSDADGDQNIKQNYTELYVERIFTIGAKQIKIPINIDYEIANSTVTTYSKEFSTTDYVGSYSTLFYKIESVNLATGIYTYSGTMAYDTTNKYNNFTSLCVVGNDVYDASNKITWFVCITNPTAMASATYAGYDKVTINGVDYPNVSSNYSLDISFNMNVHYKYMDIDMRGVTFDYDGLAHWGQDQYNYSIASTFDENKIGYYYQYDAINNKYNKDASILTEADFLNRLSNNITVYYQDGKVVNTPDIAADSNKITKVYSLNQNDFSSNSPINLVSATTPGTTVVYYKFTYDFDPLNESIDYEEEIGFYTITINYLQRNVTLDLEDKEYNGSAIYDTYANGQYLPKYTVELAAGPDGNPLDDTYLGGRFVTAKYVKEYTQDELDYPVDAGKYTVKLTIPKSAYYPEQTVTGTFTINPKSIYLLGTYNSEYTGSVVSYNDFYADNSPYKFYINNGNGGLVEYDQYQDPVTSVYSYANLRVSNLVLYTTSAVRGTYSASKGTSANGLYYTGQPRITLNNVDVATNFRLYTVRRDSNNVILDEAKLNIKEGTIIYTVNNTEYTYEIDSNDTPIYRTASVTVSNPVVGATVYYSVYSGTNAVWSTEAPRYNVINWDQGVEAPYTFYAKIVAANYTTVVDIPVTCKILKAETTISISDESKVYDGISVKIPAVITTNNNETNGQDYKFQYQVWKMEDYEYKWKDLASNEFPVNAGKYKLIMTIPGSTSFYGKTQEFEFTISGKPVSLNWDKKSFVYNGKSQRPEATFEGYDTDPNFFDKNNNRVVHFYYSITPAQTNAVVDTNYAAVGLYTITAMLKDNSGNDITNYTFDQASMTCDYYIVKRKIQVELSAAITYEATANNYMFYYAEPSDSATLSIFAGTYSVSNLVDKHEPQPTSYLKTSSTNPGNYIAEGSEYKPNFSWVSATSSIQILDTSNGNSDVTSNYTVTYNLHVNVNYSMLKIYAKSVETDYDGNYHHIEMACGNVFDSGPTEPTYSYWYAPNNETDASLGTYSADMPTFKNAGVYKVFYRAEYSGFVPINGVANPNDNCYAYVTIKKVDAGLTTQNSAITYSKYYDGMKVPNPEMKFTKATTLSTADLIYKWYQRVHDNTLYIQTEANVFKKINAYDNSATYYEKINATDYEVLQIDSETAFISTIALKAVYIKDVNGNYIQYKTFDSNGSYYSLDTASDGTTSYVPQSSITSAELYNGFAAGYNEVSEARNAGHYKLIITKANLTNYEDATYIREFDIYKRTITIYGVTSNISKEYDADRWEAQVNTSDLLTYDLMSIITGGSTKLYYYYQNRLDTEGLAVSTDTGNGMVSGQSFGDTAKVVTLYANAGTYATTEEFAWQSGAKIYGTDENNLQIEVQRNYDIKVTLQVTITKAHFDVTSSDYKRMVDMKEHGIVVKVNKPDAYTILYSTDNIEFLPDPITRSEVGVTTVYFKLSAPNYVDYLGQNKITITGVVDDGTLVYTEDLIYGDQYDAPRYETLSKGKQSVKYFSDANYAVEVTPKPVNVGTYYFVLSLETDGLYAAQELEGTFTIAPKEITVDWGYIKDEYNEYLSTDTHTWISTKEFSYTGEVIKPTAIVSNTLIDLDYATNQYYRTDVIDEESNPFNLLVLSLECDNNINVGTHTVRAVLNDNNYTLLNNEVSYKITKKQIDIPFINDYDLSKNYMVFEYHFLKSRQDSNGNIVYLGDGNRYESPTTYVPTDTFYQAIEYDKVDILESEVSDYYYFDSVDNVYKMASSEIYDVTEKYYKFELQPNVTKDNYSSYYVAGNNEYYAPQSYDDTGSTTYFVKESSSSMGNGFMYVFVPAENRYVYTNQYQDGQTYYRFTEIIDVNKTNFQDFFIYTGNGTEDIREFGEEVVVSTVDGMKYVLDSEGNIIKTITVVNDENVVNTDPDLPYKIVISSDSNADTYDRDTKVYSSYHTLTISLKDKENYCWKDVSDYDSDRVFKYLISPYTLPNQTDATSIKATITQTKIEYTGAEIKPVPKVRFYQANDLIYTLVEGEDYELSYDNNTEISFDDTIAYKHPTEYVTTNAYYSFVSTGESAITVTRSNYQDYFVYDQTRKMYVQAKEYSEGFTYYTPKAASTSEVNSANYKSYYIIGVNNDSYAKIIIKGIGNLEFEYILEFEIVDKAPAKFELVEGALPTFIYANEESGNVTIDDIRQSGSMERNDENTTSIYLGHLHQKNTIEKLLTQFANNTDLISVYKVGVNPEDPTSTPIDQGDYATEYIGSGYTLVLKDDKGNIVDTIKCILTGDLNGDGYVDAADANIYSYINSNKINYSGFTMENNPNESYYINNGIYDVAQYYASMIDAENNSRPNATQQNTIFFYVRGVSADFNGEYDLDNL